MSDGTRELLLESVRGVLDDMVQNSDWLLGFISEHTMDDPSLFGDEDLVNAVQILKSHAEAARASLG